MDKENETKPNNNEPSANQLSEEEIEKKQMKEILSYIETTDLEFVQIEKDGKKISFRRSREALQSSQIASVISSSSKEKEEASTRLFSIRSPIVGKFYSSMGPDRPPLVVEGGRVTAGQKVAIVEAMKIKKEVFSVVSGKIVRILVRDGDAVEYGQELFSVEPEKENANE